MENNLRIEIKSYIKNDTQQIELSDFEVILELDAAFFDSFKGTRKAILYSLENYVEREKNNPYDSPIEQIISYGNKGSV